MSKNHPRFFPLKNLPAALFVCGLLFPCGHSATAAEFLPGETWLDTAGSPIQAHGGGILAMAQEASPVAAATASPADADKPPASQKTEKTFIYYWYGEDRTPGSRPGVSCYSSTNLRDWKHEGVSFRQQDLSADIRANAIIERPKVAYNSQTGKYVMWMHLDQGNYNFAQAGVAIADSPAGPFAFVAHLRPIKDDFGFKDNDPNRQKQQGGTYRDMNLFVDDDGKAYAFYSSEDNATMYVVRLNRQYTEPETPIVQDKTWARTLVGKKREAPAPFKHNGRYYLITSGCTGWTPNAADYAVADNILGPYQMKGNPCVGSDANTTFGSQSTFVLPVAGKPGCFIAAFDRWNPRRLADSRYVWLPLMIGSDGTFTLAWRDKWDFSAFE